MQNQDPPRCDKGGEYMSNAMLDFTNSCGIQRQHTTRNQCQQSGVAEQAIKFGRGYVMIWGCMTTAGVGLMCRIEGKMDAELYEEILEDHVIQTLEYYDLDPSNFISQQDNDPKHTSKMTKK